jgi:hypothetical protein
MSLVLSGQAINAGKQDLSKDAKSNLTKLAAWINDRNIPFLITSIGMIVMLFWAGSYKDVISLGVSFYLISYFGRKATLSENQNQ